MQVVLKASHRQLELFDLLQVLVPDRPLVLQPLVARHLPGDLDRCHHDLPGRHLYGVQLDHGHQQVVQQEGSVASARLPPQAPKFVVAHLVHQAVPQARQADQPSSPQRRLPATFAAQAKAFAWHQTRQPQWPGLISPQLLSVSAQLC